MTWNHSGATVVSSVVNPSGALDLSSIVGTNVTMVLLKVTEGTGSVGWCRVSPESSPIGCNYTAFDATKKSGYILGYTDSAGTTTLEGSGTITADLLGWIECDASGATVFGPAGFPTWSNLDLSAYLGPKEGVALLEWIITGGSVCDGQTRFSGDPNNAGYGANTTQVDTVTYPNGLVAVPANSSGVIQINDPSANAGQIDLPVYLTQGNGWNPLLASVYSGAYPPGTWTDLDLSAHVGTNRALVCLLVDLGAGLATNKFFAFRSKDDGSEHLSASITNGYGSNGCQLAFNQGAYIFVETDANGVVQWKNDAPDQNATVSLVGYAPEAPPTPPVLEDTWPTGVVLAQTSIGGRITDAVGLDLSTLNLSGESSAGQTFDIIVGGVIQSGWSGTLAQINDAGSGPKELLIDIKEWPDTVPNGCIVTFTLTIANDSGLEI